MDEHHLNCNNRSNDPEEWAKVLAKAYAYILSWPLPAENETESDAETPGRDAASGSVRLESAEADD